MLLEKHPEAFSPDFGKNKEALGNLALIPSKQLRNNIAGYLAKALKVEAAVEETEEAEVAEEAEAPEEPAEEKQAE